MRSSSLNVPHPAVPAGDVEAALAAVPGYTAAASALGTRTGEYLETLRRLGAFDLTTARVVEPHLDALVILGEAGVTPSAALPHGEIGAWGVFASRSPQLRALDLRDVGEGWVLDGTKPWCSLGSQLTHALVTADTAQGQRLFAVRLDDARVRSRPEPWIARGLTAIRSTSLEFERMPATPIGEPGFYLGRDGFAWTGIGVAAVWAGGADALIASIDAACRRREPDQIALMHRGHLDAVRHVIDVTLSNAATAIDEGRASGRDGKLLSARVRTIVASATEDVITTVGHALGPAPLVGDEEHARRVADLTVYLRQHHAERDAAALGSMVLGDNA